MTHDIIAGQVAEANVINFTKHPHGHIQTGYRAARQILLGFIAGDDDFGAKADTG